MTSDVTYVATPSDRMPYFSNLASEAEVLTKLGFSPYTGSPVFEEAAPGTVLWRNALGGTVITCTYHTDMTPLHRFSEARKAYCVKLLDRLAGRPLPYVCGNDQDVLVLARARKGGGSIVLAANLNSEPIDVLRLRAPDATAVSVLGPDGTWCAVPFTRDGEWFSISTNLAFYQAKVFRITRQ